MKLSFPLISIQIFLTTNHIAFHLSLCYNFITRIFTRQQCRTSISYLYNLCHFSKIISPSFSQLQATLPAWQNPSKSHDLLAAHNTRQPAIFSLYSILSISFSLSALLSIQFSRYIDRLLPDNTASHCSSAPSWPVRLPSGAV